MACFIIATLVEDKGRGFETVGYKVYNNTTDQYKLLSEDSIRRANIKIENAEFKDGKLVGTQGDLKRYAKLNVYDGRTVGENKIVILGKNSDGEFIIVPYPASEENLKRTVSFNELKHNVRMASFDSVDGAVIANARVEKPRDHKNMKISAIRGTFEIIEECPKFIEKLFDFGDRNGSYSSKWKVRLVKKGEKYGRDYCITNDKDTLVEFYDMTVDKNSFPIGQFVSRYNLETLKDRGHNGLCLNGEVKSWSINSDCYSLIDRWLKNQKD
jgi:hypothetical protein